MMAIASTSMRELQSIYQHLLAVTHLIETAKIQVDCITKKVFEETTLVPVKVNDYLARQWSAARLLKINPMSVSTFFKNYSHDYIYLDAYLRQIGSKPSLCASPTA